MDTGDDTASLTASEQARANFRQLVLDITWFGLAMPATARFLAVYAIRIDASPMLLGWLAALPSIVALVTSSLAGWWRGRHTDLVRALLWPGLGFRLVFLLPAFAPFMPTAWQPLWLILAVALPAIPQGVSSVLFLVLLRESIENRQITTLMSRRSLFFNLAVAGATLAFGAWLKWAPFPVNYQIMYVTAFAMSLLSLLAVQRVRVLATGPAPSPERPALRPWRAPAFRRVAFITAIAHIAFFSITPIIPLRLVDELGADEGFMSLFALAELGAAAIIATFTNRIVRRIGALPTIAIGLLSTGVAGFGFVVTDNPYLTLPASALSGAAWTLAAISLFGYFSENTPADSLTPYSTVYNQVVLLSIFIGPMLGSQLASTPLSLSAVLVIGSVLRLMAGGLIVSGNLGERAHARRVASATHAMK